MTKFLFISYNGVSLDLVWQVKLEGHLVKYYIQYPEERSVGDGFVEKVDEWEPHVDWADVIVFDEISGRGDVANRLRKEGRMVVGGTPYTDRLEDDREFGQEELRRHGISTLDYWTFTSLKDAISFVKSHPAAYVFKPSGIMQSHKNLLFVGQDERGRDLISVLERLMITQDNDIDSLQLQEVAVGIEVAIGAFFNGKKFLYPINVNFEHKRLFPGNHGPLTGEMGTSMFWSDSNRLFRETLGRFEKTLAKEGYHGYIDLNCIVNEEGVHPLEFTARFGYPTISIQKEGLLTPLAELLEGIANGSLESIEARRGCQIGVIVVIPPFPFTDPLRTREIALTEIIFMEPDNARDGIPVGVHLEDVRLVDGKCFAVGSTGSLLIVCGHGDDVASARDLVYDRIRKIIIPRKYFRNDIGQSWSVDIASLRAWGYLSDTDGDAHD